MTRIRMAFVQEFVARGKVYYYFRKPGVRIRLPGLPGSAEFMGAYQAALDAEPRIEIGAGRTIPGTISALVVAYYGSTDFGDLGPATQQYRRWLIEKFRDAFGKHPVKLLEAKHIGSMLTRIEKLHMRKQWLKMLRGLMRYAICIGMRADDPTIGFKIKQRQSDGIPTWGETEIEASAGTMRSAPVLGSRSSCSSIPGSAAATCAAWGASTYRAARSRSRKRRRARSSSSRCTPISPRPSPPPRPSG
jgi:hypothetical protein